jgi:hypothetical protein
MLLFVCLPVWADNSSLNIQLPSAPSAYNSDKFRAGELDCSNAIGGGTNVEFGVTGVINNASGLLSGNDNPSTKDVGLYARIIIPLDPPKERINCNTLYELELRKKRIEVQKLEKELENLKQMKNSGQFE